MLIFQRFIFCFLSLFCLLASEIGKPRFFSSAELISVNIGRHEELLRATLLAVERVVNFFAREYRNFNIDGVFGLQALDGILQDLLTKARSNRIQIPHDVLSLLTELHKKATLTAKKAQPFLNATDPDYYRLGFVVRHAWPFKRDFRSLDTSLSQGTHFRQDARFAGRTMDQCISDLIGDPRTGAKQCNITDECWRFIGRNKTQGYMTTHQALYLMVGEVKGCLPAIKERLFSSHGNRAHIIEDIFEALCTSIYHEVRWKEAVLKTEERSRDTGEKDIYIEQCYICGILGYHKFLSLDRLSTLLGWQLPLGCYGENARDQDDMFEEDWNNSEDSHQGPVDNVHNSDLSAGRSRLQTSRDLPGGCERHVTGVATGLLGVYLKWLLTFPSMERMLM